MNTIFEKDVISCLDVLRNGGIILYPTDTVWGIGCDATNEKAIQKIYTIKRRSEKKSMIVLVAEEHHILRYVAAPDPIIFDFLENQNRPTTLIFEGAVGLPQNLIAEDGSVAIRIVKEPFCRHLIKRLGKPIVSTSANISGANAPQIFFHISKEIIDGVDYAVQYRREESKVAQPSQIIKWNKDGSHVIIRS